MDLNNISINIRIKNKFWKIKMKTIKKKKMKIKQQDCIWKIDKKLIN